MIFGGHECVFGMNSLSTTQLVDYCKSCILIGYTTRLASSSEIRRFFFRFIPK